MSDPTPTYSAPAVTPLTGSTTATVTCPRCGTVVAAGARFCPACGSALSSSGEVVEDHLITRLRQATQGEYDVLREVGHGGMAAVYLAWDRELARYVAIKVLLPELAHHPTMSQRFLQEARTAANLDDHPSVVRVYRAKEAQGLRYFVMKYVDGCSLDQLLRSTGPLAPDLAAHVIDQVARALQYAHEHGVVHRDVKPGNILLDRAGSVVVTDFGIAKVAEAEQLTRTGFAIGTPHYMSPEQWRVEPLTPSSDQYALGVVAFHLVTGEVPFDGTQYAIQEQHLRTEPPALATRHGAVPAALSTVVRVMLAKTPPERYPDLRSVSQALSAIPRDPAPLLRERLSQLIPAAHTPGVREVPPAELRADGPDIVVERRSGPPPIVNSTPEAMPAVPPVGVDTAPKVAPTRFAPVADAVNAHSIPPIAPPVADDPSMPVLQPTTLRPLPLRDEVVLHPTEGQALSAPAHETLTIAPPASEVVGGGALADAADPLAPPAAPLLEGPITRRDRPRRVGPWIAAAVVVAMLIGGGVALRSRFTAGSGSPDVAAARAPVIAAPPAVVSPAGLATTGPLPVTDSAALATEPPADSVLEPTPAGPPGPPAALLVVGGPTHGTLTLPAGDSVRLRARVNDARGTRLVNATVQWASSDPAYVAFRNGWAVGLAPGGPVAVTATSGALARAVHLVVVPRAGPVVVSTRSITRPTAAELRSEVQRFVGALNAHDAGEVSRRLAPRAVDGSSARDFVTWMQSTKGLAADAPALGNASDEGNRARVAFRVPLRWQSGGASGDPGRKDVTFWMTLNHDDQGWHGGEVLLGGRVAP